MMIQGKLISLAANRLHSEVPALVSLVCSANLLGLVLFPRSPGETKLAWPRFEPREGSTGVWSSQTSRTKVTL